MKRFSEIGPLEWLGHRAIEVVDEGEYLRSQIFSGNEVAATEQLTHQNTEPDLHLVQPRCVLGRVVKDDLVRGMCQERGTRGHRFQNPVLLLDAQVLGKT